MATDAVYDGADPHPESILGRIIARDKADHEAVRAEIVAKGTWWAATEILELRRKVASLKRNSKSE